MITVNLIADFAPIFLRQSPEGDGIWENVHFFANSQEPTDYTVIFNGVKNPLKVTCQRGNLWLLMQEPPTEFWKPLHQGTETYDKIFTQDTDLAGSRYFWSQPANNWWVNRSYSELVGMQPCVKNKKISAIMSDMANFKAHRDRKVFLGKLKESVSIDHYGKGFQEIGDKWEGLESYQYSLAVENYSNQYYWTEKIADCFLAWTMPIYCGCTRITEYFPAESMIVFDMYDPYAIDKILDTISGDAWSKNYDAIEYARNLVLNRYQLLPFLSDQIRSYGSLHGVEKKIYRHEWVRPVTVKSKSLDYYKKKLFRMTGICKRVIGY